MIIIHVQAGVKPECIEAFTAATLENAAASRREAGIARFDLLRQTDDPARFLLIEEYRTPEAAAAHKETGHYKKWRDAVAPMMAQPRQSVRYSAVDEVHAI